jgi:hypothetical protein
VASAATGIGTGETTPEVARRSWPGWLALGVAALAVAAAALIWPSLGAALVLGALGAFLAGRGAVLLRSAGALDGELAGRARVLGPASVVVGLAALAVAVGSPALAGRVLLVAVPLLLIGTAGALLARGGPARIGGGVLLAWTVLVTALVVVRGSSEGWHGATRLATGTGAVAVALLAVPLLVGAANLRGAARRPAPPPPAARRRRPRRPTAGRKHRSRAAYL